MTAGAIRKLEKTLTIIAAVLVVIIAAGTFAGLVKKAKANVDAGSKQAQNLIAKGKATALNAPVSDSQTAYFELGTIRLSTASTKKEESVTMVISPWLSYPTGDDVFYEELAKKRSIIKGLFSSYFSGKTKAQLSGKSEDKITEELIEEINARLSLGKITGINFTDYIFID